MRLDESGGIGYNRYCKTNSWNVFPANFYFILKIVRIYSANFPTVTMKMDMEKAGDVQMF